MVLKRVKKFCVSGGDPPNPPFELMQYRYDEQPPNQQVRDQLEAARAYWNSVLPDPLPPVNLAGAGGDPAYTQIRVEVTFPAIDGASGILAQAGAFNDFRRGSRVVQGIMQVDISDAANLAAQGRLVDVIKHELFHVLTSFRDAAVSGPLCNNDQHVGANAVAEYSALTGGAEAFIPMEPGDCHHWSEVNFGVELQTPFYNGGTTNPNSRMSIAVLEDLNYPNVNYAPAEPYFLGQAFTLPAGQKPLKWSCAAEDGLCVIRKVED